MRNYHRKSDHKDRSLTTLSNHKDKFCPEPNSTQECRGRVFFIIRPRLPFIDRLQLKIPRTRGTAFAHRLDRRRPPNRYLGFSESEFIMFCTSSLQHRIFTTRLFTLRSQSTHLFSTRLSFLTSRTVFRPYRQKILCEIYSRLRDVRSCRGIMR